MSYKLSYQPDVWSHEISRLLYGFQIRQEPPQQRCKMEVSYNEVFIPISLVWARVCIVFSLLWYGFNHQSMWCENRALFPNVSAWRHLQMGAAFELCKRTFQWFSFDKHILYLSICNLICRSIFNALWPGGLAKMGHFLHHTDVTKVLAISRRFGCRLWTLIGAHGHLRVLIFNF